MKTAKDGSVPAPTAAMPLAVASHALTGTVAELVPAHMQIATSMAQMQLNGFDTVQKCTAACWMAHGIGEHPAVFIQNHWALVIKGRLTIEPKWEYMVRKLKETVPGFRFEVVEEDDERATVKMSDGVDSHVVTYSVEDARRQGLMGAANAWSSGSTREMCFKMAVKRAARRIGVGRAAPWVEMDMPETGSEAVVVDEGAVSSDPDGARRAAQPGNGASDPVSSSSKGATAPSERPVIMRLSDALFAVYGKQTKTVALEKATFIYNEMVARSTGTNPGAVFKKVEDIGPVDAELMIEFLADYRPNGDGPEQAKPVPSSSGTGPAITAPVADEPPPAESADTRLEDDDNLTPAEDYERFMLLVKRAKKLTGRKFVTEAPQGSGNFWMIDAATFSQAGHTVSQKLMNADGEIVIAQDSLKQLARILAADCDQLERSR